MMFQKIVTIVFALLLCVLVVSVQGQVSKNVVRNKKYNKVVTGRDKLWDFIRMDNVFLSLF